MLRRLSLRARLLLGVIALAAIGLIAADVITYSKLSSFLITARLLAERRPPGGRGSAVPAGRAPGPRRAGAGRRRQSTR